MKSLLPRPQLAADRLSRIRGDRWRPSSSAALFSTSQPLGDDIRQAHPRGAYYDMLLTNPIPYAPIKNEGPPCTAHPASASVLTAAASTPPPLTRKQRIAETQKVAAERARIVFGSRLAGPVERAERLAAIRSRSKMIAGVLVPPRPEEPENCCMSGCVDCVWDRFRDEMEEWAMATAEASKRLKTQEGGVASTMDGALAAATPAKAASPGAAPPNAVSMDDDGGGSDSNWDVDSGPPQSSSRDGRFWNEDLYQSVPVGIREFMKQEKRLKLKHQREGTMGG